MLNNFISDKLMKKDEDEFMSQSLPRWPTFIVILILFACAVITGIKDQQYEHEIMTDAFKKEIDDWLMRTYADHP